MIEHLLQPLVCDRFRNDARYREGHLRVVNALPGRKVLGLHVPEMKALAKQLSKNGAEVNMPCGKHPCGSGKEIISCFRNVPPESLCYEETVIWGLLINLEKCSAEERFAMLSLYVPVMDNWAVCDSYCSDAKWMRHMDKEQLWNFLLPWFSSSREFEVRFAVVASMCCFLGEDWLEKVFAMLEKIDFTAIGSEYRTIKGKPEQAQKGTVQGTSPYYVRMGVAWLLATALAKNPQRTRDFVNKKSLPADVMKLYVRKVRESFRTRHVSPF